MNYFIKNKGTLINILLEFLCFLYLTVLGLPKIKFVYMKYLLKWKVRSGLK